MQEESIKPKADILFEVSWEVCNKVGGIYTVVKSKAAQMANYYKDNHFLVGPYFAKQALGEFSEEIPKDYCKSPFDELKKEGIICHYGKWLIEGNPTVILIDFEGFKQKINDIKKDLWEYYKIDSLRTGYDYDEPVAWSYAAGKLIEKLARVINKKIVAHFHEWLSGAALLYLKKKKANVGTVFTTHATTLGRTLANSNVDLYSLLDKLDVDKEIYKYSIESKHLLEKQSALHSDVFTTVSEITGMEAEYLLGRKPDVLLLNGLDIEKFPTFEETSVEHRVQRERIREFILYYFFPYYTFDLNETLIYFIASRYEFHDKGIDIFIKALGTLNNKMKKFGNKKTIIAFLWVPANIRNIKPDLLENKTYYQDIKDSMDDVTEETNRNVMRLVMSSKKISKSSLFEKNFLLEIKGKLNRFAKDGQPPISTHDLYDGNDAIVKSLKEANLKNYKEDPVKVIYYPIYLSGADSLLNLNYYESIQGSHLGIFPSYYEPWGYTPLETSALGVTSVTTDLAGFGKFLCREHPQSDNPGIFILRRFGKTDEEVIQQLVKIMLDFSNLSKHNRIANKIQAKKIASTADWKLLIKRYIKAHNMAIEKISN